MLRQCAMALGVLFLVFCNVGHVQAVSYIVTDLGTLGGSASQAIGLNDNGQIVGGSLTASGSWHAFLYSGGTMQDIGTLNGGLLSCAFDINNNGQAVGYSYMSGYAGPHAFVYSGSGPMQDLGTLDNANFSVANGINDSGAIVGGPGFNAPSWGMMAGSGHAFVYSGNVPMQDIGTLGGNDSNATGINNSGQIVGDAATTNSYETHAFRSSGPGAMLDLGNLPGGSSSHASAINDSGQVVGWSYTSNTSLSGDPHAFIFSGTGPMQDLGTLGGQSSQATGINNRGQVVGTSWTSTPAGHAFIADGNGPMQDLNSLIAPSSGWILGTANAINNKGQIVGSGINATGQSHAVLLNPFTQFSQADTHWGGHSYANGQSTIQRQGCALSSLAMVLDFVGVPQNPDTLNTLMMAHGGYSGDLVNWGAAVRAAANAAGTPNIKFHSIRSSSTAALDNLLSQGHPVVVGVNNNSHYVVVTAKQGDTYAIADPGYASRTTLDAYNNQFETRGYVADPIDVSEMDVSVVAPGSGVNLLLTDLHGNVTGIDSSGGRFELIPNSVHFIDSIADVSSGQPPTDVGQLINVFNPESGDYGIEIRGIDAALTPYTLFEKAFARDGSLLWSHEISGVAGVGSVDHYSFTYAVPEPSTSALLAIGAIGFLGYRWRRHAA